MTQKKALDELAPACQLRGAQVGVFVLSSMAVGERSGVRVRGRLVRVPLHEDIAAAAGKSRKPPRWPNRKGRNTTAWRGATTSVRAGQ